MLQVVAALPVEVEHIIHHDGGNFLENFLTLRNLIVRGMTVQ